jgi:hypothetical protein
MKHLLSVVGVPLLLALGCAFQGASPKGDAAEAGKAPKAAAARLGGEDERPERAVGDLFVHRFSGSYRPEALKLTEEVISVDKDAVVMDYTLEEGEKVTSLRVYRDPRSDRVKQVLELRGAEELPSTLLAFEQMLDKTVFAADSNQGLLEETEGTCLVGEEALDCEQKSYSVLVGEQVAVLKVAASKSVPGRDVSGELTSEDGKMLYRSELLERSQRARRPGVVAKK